MLADGSTEQIHKSVGTAVVVVGMHRSGTSALMRGLKSLGVDLGDDFHEPAADNSKGFWEDKDVLALNEKLLEGLRCRWDTIRPVRMNSESVDALRMYQEEARNILQSKFRGSELWGVKDPRVSRLLDFWIPIMESLDTKTRIIMSVRHPASIARSLAVRNQFGEEKSVLLSLAYWLDIAKYCCKKEICVVDYDEYLKEPEDNLERIADNLDIEITAEVRKEIDDFSSSFLNELLRHHKAGDEETRKWKKKGDSFALSIEIYEALLNISRGNAGMDDAKWYEYYREFDKQKSVVSYIDSVSDGENNLVQRLEEKQKELEDVRSDLEKAHLDLKQACESEKNLSQRLEQTLQYHNSLVSYQMGMKEMLDRERYTVVKPLMRRIYRLSVKMVCMLPPAKQHKLRKLKRVILQRSIPHQLPAFGSDTNLELRNEILQHFDVESCIGDIYDVIVFPVIDWHFRVQRPQHIAKGLADLGHRVFYFSTTFGGDSPGGRILEKINTRVFVCQLNIPVPHPVIYERMPDKEQERVINEALSIFAKCIDLKRTVAIVDHPFWRPAALGLPGALVIYDCMDDHGGFSNNAEEILRSEEKLLWDADLVITTSATLSQKISNKRENIIIRNAADSEWFSETSNMPAYVSGRPVVGYFGAISEWFDVELVVKAAKAYPEYDFVLIGSTYMCDIHKAEVINNIIFVGEVPYSEIKNYLYSFDVCMIPFKLIELIQCTNPVKLYEYLASGKPVVATDMPELRLVKDYVFVSENDDLFIRNIGLAMQAKDNEDAIKERKAFAMQNSWNNRVDKLEEAVTAQYPKVSVVVLTYNNLDYTRACLHSLEQFTNYPEWELILVDNASTDGSKGFLAGYAESRDNVTLLLNEENLGFAAGNNIGIQKSSGEYIVILNNDTYVTEGWIWGLLRYFRRDPYLGVLGPITNNIGNEAKIDIQYGDMTEMAEVSRKYVQEHSRQLLYIDTAAFYCAVIRKDVIDRVGMLDESFGRGFFEDDDYCKRTRNAGYRVAIADDVFIHHHLSASFDAMKSKDRQALFDRNRAIYEEKWGAWQPHRYRQY